MVDWAASRAGGWRDGVGAMGRGGLERLDRCARHLYHGDDSERAQGALTHRDIAADAAELKSYKKHALFKFYDRLCSQIIYAK